MFGMTRHPIAILGWLLLVGGGALYLGNIVAAVLRVGRLYSRAMPGARLIRVGAAFAAAARYWSFLAVALLGVAVILLSAR